MDNTATAAPVGCGSADALEQLRSAGLAFADRPLRLHLGCGETLLEGYVNIDYPPSEHNVMSVVPDVYADIMGMDFPPGTVDEIRLHHVFEHFSRVTALAMLMRWHRWLKVGGRLQIETPDIYGCAQNIVSNPDFNVKMGNIRHLAGDQAASWAYHVDHWFEERFQHTLTHLGFDQVKTSSSAWPQAPFLWNVQAIATKSRDYSEDELLKKADELLWESTVSPNERPTYEVWCKQLRAVVNGEAGPQATNVTPLAPQPNPESDAKPQAREVTPYVARSDANPQTVENLIRLWDVVRPESTDINIQEVQDFNQLGRDRWVAVKAAALSGGQHVLDIGAGTCPYKDLFSHCVYKTHDFKQYTGVKLGGTAEYGHIDYVSDIKSIPVPDGSFDVILCTEVLEHVPEPIEALREMARIVKPGGQIWMTAPLGSGLHQLPFHFYGGYTPQWYQHFCAQFGLDIAEITPNGGFFKLLSQEVTRSAEQLIDALKLEGEDEGITRKFFKQILPLRLFELDNKHGGDQFTVGYFVEAIKPLPGAAKLDPRWKEIKRRIAQNPADVDSLINAAIHLVEKKRFAEAMAYANRALVLAPDSKQLPRLLEELSKM